jgi:hypothetical protein
MKQLLLFLVLVSSVSAQQVTTLPVPEGTVSDPTLKNLVWNRWETTNYVILSIDHKQGLWLYQNIESMKEWSAVRWGLPNIDYPKRVNATTVGAEPGCMVICVPNKETMQKIWKRDGNYMEVKKNAKGIDRNFMLLVLDKSPAETMPSKLTLAHMKELESKLDTNFNLVILRGVATLNESLPQLKARITYVGQAKNLPSIKSLFGMTEKEWMGQEYLHDSLAATVCLMLRREFGQDKFHSLLAPVAEKKFQEIYKFKGFDDFEVTWKRYVNNLVQDVKNNKTPDHYLQIIPKEK